MHGPCKHCHQDMRPARMLEHEAPGTVLYGADGGCRSCRRRLGLKREIPTNCVGCDHPMRPAGALAKDYPNTRLHKGKGICDTCVKRDRPSRAKPKVEPEVDPDTVVLTDPDPEDVASLATWERHRRERRAREEQMRRVMVEAEARRREFIASRRAA